MDNYRLDQVCTVCGDRASGYNFKVLTCVSCKTFFSRNALKSKIAPCQLDNECKITKQTRRFCTKCRLEKCFAVGMKKDLIMSDKMRSQLKTLIIENRERKIRAKPQVLNREGDPSQSTDDDDQFIDHILKDMEFSEKELQNELMKLEACLFGNNENTSNNSIVPVVRPVSDYTNTLNEMEGKRLEEVLTVFKEMEYAFEPYEYKSKNLTESNYFIRIEMDRQIETLVESSKQLSLFNQICPNDQLALIKYGAIEVSNMRQVVGFDVHTNRLKVLSRTPRMTAIVDLNISVFMNDPVFSQSMLPSLLQMKIDYLHKFAAEWECDNVILNLMTAIVLFNPNRPHLLHSDLIRYHQCVYVYLLHRYLQLKYRSEDKAREKLSRLLGTIKYLNQLYFHYVNTSADRVLNEYKKKKAFEPLSPIFKEVSSI